MGIVVRLVLLLTLMPAAACRFDDVGQAFGKATVECVDKDGNAKGTQIQLAFP